MNIWNAYFTVAYHYHVIEWNVYKIPMYPPSQNPLTSYVKPSQNPIFFNLDFIVIHQATDFHIFMYAVATCGKMWHNRAIIIHEKQHIFHNILITIGWTLPCLNNLEYIQWVV